MKVSFVVPVYNSQNSLERCLQSVVRGGTPSDSLEIIIVDDGSTDQQRTADIAASFPAAVFIAQDENKGKAAAVNRGLSISTGDYVIQLDSDDELLPDWWETLQQSLATVPAAVDCILTACRTPAGEITVTGHGYRGELTLTDRLQGRYRGEYLSVFRGAFIREHLFLDPGIRRAGFEELSYLRFLQVGHCWIVPEVLRIYHASESHGLAGGWWNAEQAADRARFLEMLLDRFEPDYRRHAPLELKRKYLRLAAYRKLAGKPDASRAFFRGLHPVLFLEILGCLVLFAFGAGPFRRVVLFMQRTGLLRRWG